MSSCVRPYICGGKDTTNRTGRYKTRVLLPPSQLMVPGITDAEHIVPTGAAHGQVGDENLCGTSTGIYIPYLLLFVVRDFGSR